MSVVNCMLHNPMVKCVCACMCVCACVCVCVLQCQDSSPLLSGYHIVSIYPNNAQLIVILYYIVSCARLSPSRHLTIGDHKDHATMV